MSYKNNFKVFNISYLHYVEKKSKLQKEWTSSYILI